MTTHDKNINLTELKKKIQSWSDELGFNKIGISHIDLPLAENRLNQWLQSKYHGTMQYMEKHGSKRSRPNELLPGTLSIISVRMDYWPEPSLDPWQVLANPELAYISRYALGRDYHKVLKKRLQQLAHRLGDIIGDFGYRVFVDSAPVLEKPIAEQAGLGWIGKHTNLLSRDSGSWFFLGEIYTDLALPADQAMEKHCGTCQACIDICPTKAIIAPFQLDARLCISYLTIEYKGVIPQTLRAMMGNRIYGCDDCQLVCPWNRFASVTAEADFQTRHRLDHVSLIDLFQWSETVFLRNTEGSAMRRVGYECWLRNIAIAMGNAPPHSKILQVLTQRLPTVSALVQEHIQWAIEQQV